MDDRRIPAEPGGRVWAWRWGPDEDRRPGLPWIGVFLVLFGVLLLVPATMRLMGRWNWWAPGPLGRLADRLGFSHVEDEPDGAAEPDAGADSIDRRASPGLAGS
jgi:hypothetical protein